MSSGPFSRAALERLSSPEKLDQLIRVTSPSGWIGLGAVLAFLVTIFAWGFVGTLNTRVMAEGILLGGSVYDLVPLAPGQITRLDVQLGDEVAAGQLIAEISQPELLQSLRETRARLSEMRETDAELRSFGARDSRIQSGLLVLQRENLLQTIETMKERVRYLETQIEVEADLLDRGLITRQQLLQTQQSRDSARGEVERAEAELQQLSARELTVEFNLQQQLGMSEQRVREMERLVEQIEGDLALRSRIVTPYPGRVIEISTNPGDLVSPGQPVAKLGLSRNDVQELRVIMYVSTRDGKRIEPGMQMLVSPATVKPEEYGFMVGRVERVSEYPVTTASMMHVLRNEGLVRQLAASGAPFEVVATLTPAAGSPSGFLWTSGVGPDVQIQSGTPGMSRITVRSQRPIAMLIPAIRDALALY